MAEEWMLFLIFDESGEPLEFSLSDLLETNFVWHASKEENIKELNELIQAIEEYRDNL